MSHINRKLRLSAEQISCLLQVPSISAELQTVVRNAPGGRLLLTPDQKEELESRVADHLQRIGFDRNFEPTSEGRMLEAILDSLNASESG